MKKALCYATLAGLSVAMLCGLDGTLCKAGIAAAYAALAYLSR